MAVVVPFRASSGKKSGASSLAFGPVNSRSTGKIFSPQPGQQLAFPSGHGRVLREVGMAIDQARENRDRTVIYPANALGTLSLRRKSS